jgi:hypothetical protein
MGAAWLFYNPGAQGAHIVGEALLTAPHAAQARAIMSGMAMIGFLLAEMGRGGDDEDERAWKNIPPHVKDTNMVVRAGDHQVTVPVSYGFGLFHSIGNTVSNLLHGQSASDASMALAGAVIRNFSVFGNPFLEKDGQVEFAPDQVLPTAIKMGIGPSINRDSFGREIAPTKHRASLPDSQNMTRALRGSSYAAISATLNDWTGGNAYQAGAVDVSPNVLKYWVTSLAGGFGRFVGDTADAGIGAAQGVAPDLKNVPIARKFVRESDVADSRAAFWPEARKSLIAAEQVAAAIRGGDGDIADEIKETEEAALSLAKFAGKTIQLATAKRNAVEKIMKDEDLSLAEKREEIKEIEESEQEVYDAFLQAFDER